MMVTTHGCPHDLAERETECADGACPICQSATIARLKAELLRANDNCQELHHSLELYRADIRVMREREDKMTAERSAMREEIRMQKKLVDDYADSFPLLNQALQKAERERVPLRHEIERLKTELRQGDATIDTMKEEIERLNRDLVNRTHCTQAAINARKE